MVSGLRNAGAFVDVGRNWEFGTLLGRLDDDELIPELGILFFRKPGTLLCRNMGILLCRNPGILLCRL